jgi:hypothetical protein
VPRFVAGEVLGVIEMYFSALLLADALMPRDTVSAITRFSVFMEIILSPYIVCANIMFLSNSACKGFLCPAHFVEEVPAWMRTAPKPPLALCNERRRGVKL